MRSQFWLFRSCFLSHTFGFFSKCSHLYFIIRASVVQCCFGPHRLSFLVNTTVEAFLYHLCFAEVTRVWVNNGYLFFIFGWTVPLTWNIPVETTRTKKNLWTSSKNSHGSFNRLCASSVIRFDKKKKSGLYFVFHKHVLIVIIMVSD